MQNFSIALLTAILVGAAGLAQGQTLTGSRASMQRQHQEAIKYGYTFIKTSQGVQEFVDSGYLVKVGRSAHVDLHDVSFPYARPAVKTFIERLGAQYYAACGEKMTVTSLTRPTNRQPANAATDSVHPTGMAVDLRIPGKGKCRTWLENTLLSLEASDVLDVTRERNPPHYHVAVFTESYQQYASAAVETGHEYVVRKGDSLSRIATSTGTDIARLRAANGLRGDLIRVGQKLVIPGTAETHSVAAAEAPAALPEIAANMVAAVNEVSHRVKRGETLWRIAKRYGISVDLLRRQNGLADDFLDVGQVLLVRLN
jgi:LysM repeat protein